MKHNKPLIIYTYIIRFTVNGNVAIHSTKVISTSALRAVKVVKRRHPLMDVVYLLRGGKVDV